MNRLKQLFRKGWDLLFRTEGGLYLVFGGLTTLVSLLAFWISDAVFGSDNLWLSTVIKNIAGILFAYFTNRAFVFKSAASAAGARALEMGLFVGIRGLLIAVDAWTVLFLLNRFGLDRRIGTVFSTVLVIALNYLASKFVIFRKD